MIERQVKGDPKAGDCVSDTEERKAVTEGRKTVVSMDAFVTEVVSGFVLPLSQGQNLCMRL